jgi:hypothetical protein
MARRRYGVPGLVTGAIAIVLLILGEYQQRALTEMVPELTSPLLTLSSNHLDAPDEPQVERV